MKPGDGRATKPLGGRGDRTVMTLTNDFEERFRALRRIATLFKALAWIVLLLGLASAAAAVVLGGTLQERLGAVSPGTQGNIVALASTAAAVVLIAVVYFIVLYAFGEGIHVLLAVEQNTRETAALTREMWSAFGPPRKASGGFPGGL